MTTKSRRYCKDKHTNFHPLDVDSEIMPGCGGDAPPIQQRKVALSPTSKAIEAAISAEERKMLYPSPLFTQEQI